jgi:Zn-dependent protease with chaperone function
MLCSLVYLVLGGFLLGGTYKSFQIAIAIYIFFIMIIITDVAESLLRFLYGIRKIETSEERDYLTPIFASVLKVRPNKKNRYKIKKRGHWIELYIIDDMAVNAMALGKSTIAVTKGAIKAFDEEQLKAILAHEVAHILSGDTVASMLLLFGSGFFYLLVLLFRLIILVMDKLTASTEENTVDRSVGNFMCSFVRILSKVLIFVFSFIMQIVTAIESRKKEYRADMWTYKMGHGEGLISALYLLEKISLTKNGDFVQKLTASHPRTTARIGMLEGYGDR